VSKIIAIDPTGCGCTECVVGDCTPYNRATAKQLQQMLKGKIRNNTYVPDAAVREHIQDLEGYGVSENLDAASAVARIESVKERLYAAEAELNNAWNSGDLTDLEYDVIYRGIDTAVSSVNLMIEHRKKEAHQ
jgi:hypothetical protein